MNLSHTHLGGFCIFYVDKKPVHFYVGVHLPRLSLSSSFNLVISDTIVRMVIVLEACLTVTGFSLVGKLKSWGGYLLSCQTETVYV